MDDDCVDNDAAKWSASTNFKKWRAEEKRENFFSFISCFIIIIIIIIYLFFQSCYKDYSLHDCKLKNTQECTA